MAAGPEAGGECGICYEAYWGAGGSRAPQELPCHHSLCLSCLRKLVCRAATIAFVSCPFCRMVTLVPEVSLGEPAPTLASGTPRGEEEVEEGSSAPSDTHQASGSSMAVEVGCATHAPVFAVSGMVSPCGLRQGSEAPGTFLLGLLGRGLMLDTQPPIASMENLRLGFAAGILILIVSTFFLLVFLKVVYLLATNQHQKQNNALCMMVSVRPFLRTWHLHRSQSLLSPLEAQSSLVFTHMQTGTEDKCGQKKP